MKTKYILQILPLLFILFIVGCSKEDIIPTDDAKEYNVSLKFNGEITTTDIPLTRGTATNDLIGVQVYQDGEEFAHGLFDNIEDININLHSDHKYKFVVTVVKDGKNKISYGDDSSYKSGGYGKPFISYGSYRSSSSSHVYTNGYRSTPLMNYFKYSSTGYENGTLQSGQTSTAYPRVDRFYGEVENYTPTENGEVAIDLKRTAFGLKYEVSGVTDGTVSVKISNSSCTFFENTAITADYQSEGEIFTFSDVYSAWKYADNYTESITISASWARDVGINENLGSKTVQIKRNAMNIIRLKLSSVSHDGSIGIEVEEETGMEEENVTGTLE